MNPDGSGAKALTDGSSWDSFPAWAPDGTQIAFARDSQIWIAGVGPALITAPYPEHPSGHLCFSSSSLHALQAFFGTDEVTFYVTSSRFPGEMHYFHRFSDAIKELIEARIWAGLHFRTADEQAAMLGQKVARYTRVHYFEPPR